MPARNSRAPARLLEAAELLEADQRKHEGGQSKKKKKKKEKKKKMEKEKETEKKKKKQGEKEVLQFYIYKLPIDRPAAVTGIKLY